MCEVASVSKGNVKAELYDLSLVHIPHSGTASSFITHYPSPYLCSRQVVFYAIGTGTLQIDVLNGLSAVMLILLREALACT